MFNIITRKTLLFYCKKYPKGANALLEWYHEFKDDEFKSFQELKAKYGNASLVDDNRIIFNIAGNHFRLVVRIGFKHKAVQIKWFGTHAEYDKIDVSTVKFKINGKEK